MIRGSAAAGLVLMLAATIPLHSQARVVGDLEVEWSPASLSGGAQVMQRKRALARSPVASQFDSLGTSPLGAVGDSITIYYFADGANITARRHAKILKRQRFFPPTTWRTACDAVAHPGWLYSMSLPATSSFALVVPGVREMPIHKDPAPTVRLWGKALYKAWADSAWDRWNAASGPRTEREYATRWYQFYSDSLDAEWYKVHLQGVVGPGGQLLTVYSAWLHDDYSDGTANTAATWLVNSGGGVVGRQDGHLDIYGVTDSDHDGIDEVVTSRGLIRWDGTIWRFPTVYSEEPCLMHQVMSPPPGRRD